MRDELELEAEMNCAEEIVQETTNANQEADRDFLDAERDAADAEYEKLYEEYEDLIIARDAYQREAGGYETAYIKEFGELINKVFEKEIECISKKKSIKFCQMAVNRGELINLTELQAFIDAEMSSYNSQLSAMVDDYKNARKAGQATEMEFLRSKSMYRRIAKLIHPDMNPAVWEEAGEEVKELWEKVKKAYGSSDVHELQHLEVLVNKILREAGIKIVRAKIADIEKRIEILNDEIDEIISTAPYTFGVLLEDADLVAEKKKSLEVELKAYERYARELDEELKAYMTKGMTVEWDQSL